MRTYVSKNVTEEQQEQEQQQEEYRFIGVRIQRGTDYQKLVFSSNLYIIMDKSYLGWNYSQFFRLSDSFGQIISVC